jgi:hypothetical protein
MDGEVRVAVEVGEPPFESRFEVPRSPGGGLGSDPQLLTGSLIVEQGGVLTVPEVDLAQETGADLAAGDLDRRQDALIDLLGVLRDCVLDRP